MKSLTSIPFGGPIGYFPAQNASEHFESRQGIPMQEAVQYGPLSQYMDLHPQTYRLCPGQLIQ